MKWFKSLRLQYRLMLAFLMLGVLPAVITGIMTVRSLESTLIEDTKKKLTMLKESQAVAVEKLFQQMGANINTMASNPTTIEAARLFAHGFVGYAGEWATRPKLDFVRSELMHFYTEEFSAAYQKQNGGTKPEQVEQWLSGLSDSSLLLQYSYLKNNPNPLGSKDKLSAADDGTLWSKTHATFHPFFRQYIQTYGYYDLFIVDPASGNVVYSTYKELEFATSLNSGVSSQSNIRQAFEAALKLKEGEYHLTDLAPYLPSYDAMAGFMATPIVDQGQVIAVLILQVPVDKIDSIMTADRSWRDRGLGDTAEVYLVGGDKKARTISRIFAESPNEFLIKANDFGWSQADTEYIRNKANTAGVFKVETYATHDLSQGKTGFARYQSYMGVDVFGSYRQLNLKGLNWSIIAEMSAAEALHLDTIKWVLGLILGLSILVILIVSYLVTSTLTSRLNNIVVRLRDTSKQTEESTISVKKTSQEVSNASTEQASAIQETVSTLNEITAMVDKSVEYARQSADTSSRSEKVAHDGQKAVSEMSKSMDEINASNNSIMEAVNDSNDKIKGIVKVIQEIANKTTVINDIVFQTKLLSFNASVEAARAGEHGKGFAVVAEEVGNLAQMSGKAATEIGQMLAESIDKVESIVKESSTRITKLTDLGQAKVQTGVEVAKRCGDVLDEVVRNVSSVNSMMDEISQAAKEQAEGVSNITTAMNELDTTTHINSTAAHKAAQDSESLERQTQTLLSLVRDLELEIHGGAAQNDSIRAGSDPSWDHHSAPAKPSVAQEFKTSKVTPIRKLQPGPQAQVKIASGQTEVPSSKHSGFEEL